MKICTEHWTALKSAIAARGLSHLVRSGENAVKSAVGEAHDFDPLLYCHNGIVSQAIEIVGLYLMQDNDDGTERCPLCFMIGHCGCTEGDACKFRKWIDQSADFALEVAKERGLVAST